MNRKTTFSQRNIIYLLVQALIFAIGIAIMQLDGPAWVAIGTSLVATGVAGAALFAYIYVTDRWVQRFEVLTEFGVIDAFSARSARIKDIYDARLSRARTHVDLLGFGQSAFRGDYEGELAAWVARGVHVRVLLIDPTFPNATTSYASQRDREERNPEGDVARDVEAFLAATLDLRTRHHDKFEVRLYRCLPTVNVFRIDDVVFWGPYLMHEQSRNSPTFLVERGGTLFDRFTGHFEAIWSSDELSIAPSDQ